MLQMHIVQLLQRKSAKCYKKYKSSAVEEKVQKYNVLVHSEKIHKCFRERYPRKSNAT